MKICGNVSYVSFGALSQLGAFSQLSLLGYEKSKLFGE